MADLDANKQLCRDYFAAFVRRDEAWWAKHIAPAFLRHDPGLPFQVKGPEGVKQLADALHPGIPDMQLPIEDVIAEGEKVLVRLRVKGTHGGELMACRPHNPRSTSASWTCSTSATASSSSTGPCSTTSAC